MEIASYIVLALLAVLFPYLLWRKRQSERERWASSAQKSNIVSSTIRRPGPFSLIPNKGVGLLSFGDTLERVRTVLGSEDSNSRAGGTSEYKYLHLGSIIEVSDENGIIAFKFFKPASPHYDGEDLLKLPFLALAKKLSELDKSTAMTASGMIRAPALGIAACAANPEHAPQEPPEFIHFTCHGYWDEA